MGDLELDDPNLVGDNQCLGHCLLVVLDLLSTAVQGTLTKEAHCRCRGSRHAANQDRTGYSRQVEGSPGGM